MNRRALLTAGVLLFAGCTNRPDGDETAETPDTTTTAPPSASDRTTDVAEDILIRVTNNTSGTRTVHLTVNRDGETHVEKSVTLDADASSYVDPEITETGDYELAIETDAGRTHRRPFDVEDYDLGMGSNLIVVADTDSIRVLMEE
ncbi:hypothetical protein [Halorientalis salina]|uniref:hypothetical protein n=1 Tax=Halorientalis salina TaxID=2932266 RepID=UPI0010AB99D8|nr:hypothetical protein [Halorientalis salina]